MNKKIETLLNEQIRFNLGDRKIKFLKENKCLLKYLNNTINHLKEIKELKPYVNENDGKKLTLLLQNLDKVLNHKSFILASFSFSKAPEDITYWYNLSIKYMKSE